MNPGDLVVIAIYMDRYLPQNEQMIGLVTAVRRAEKDGVRWVDGVRAEVPSIYADVLVDGIVLRDIPNHWMGVLSAAR